MPGQRNPAETPGFARWITELWDAVKQIRKDVRELQTARQTYFQEAEVTAFTAMPFATVKFSPSNDTMIVNVPVGYTPAVGHIVLVGISQYRSSILVRLS